MRLYVDLSANEEASIRGWQLYYAAHPQFIGLPTPANPQQPPNYQTRIVLDAQTRERYDQIAAQLNVLPVPEPHVVLREFVDGDPANQPGNRFLFTSQNDLVSAIPFRMPMTWTNAAGKASASEYLNGGTGFALAQISAVPGDMDGAYGSGSNLTIDFVAGQGIYLPGALLYYNHRMAAGHAPRGTGFSVSFPV